ncbi:MAG: hypothetical protein K5857_01080 [Lachnospiraceae bacterium]|nr:hypothetical protein [Lachnospiraceae bacterium]
MSIFDKFKKGRKDIVQEDLDALKTNLLDDLDDGIVGEVEHGGPVRPIDEGPVNLAFVMGVLDVQPVEGTDNLVVSGNIKGNAENNMAVSLINFGEDNRETVMTAIQGISADGESLDRASDGPVSMILEDGAIKNVRVGTVIYAGNIGEDQVHDAYVSALGDSYVKDRVLDLSDDEIGKLTITDCSEIWRLNSWYVSHAGKDEDEEIKEDRKKRLDKIIGALCDKIREADEIYYVHDKRTGEAHLFSQTVEAEDGAFFCSPPGILLVSKAYRRHYRKLYNNDKTELAVVRNGDDKKGIYNFLAGNFYINGACGAAVNAVQVSVSADMLVEKPDHTGIPVENIPVTNPDLVRWMLLIGQMDKPDAEDEGAALDFKLYYRFMGIEMLKARFIIPMKHEGDGKDIATMKGKGDKDALIMYTDWRRLRSEYGKEWDGMVHSIRGLIDKFDCAVNPTRFPAAGSYVTREMYNSMVEMARADKASDKG